jgi:hypothetical protein
VAESHSWDALTVPFPMKGITVADASPVTNADRRWYFYWPDVR